MAKLIPTYYISKDNLLGEHRIFQLLKQSKELEDYYIFHSLNIVNHQNKREGEADFIVLGPRGILDIEIKGSNKVICEEGKWSYFNKNGSYTAHESPFNQAKTNIYSLISNIDKNVKGLLFRDLKKFVGYGVIFPNMIFNIESVEWDKKLVLDENHLDNLSNFISDLFYFWRSKSTFVKGLDVIPKEDIEKIKQYLRGNFETIESVRSFLKKNAHKIDLLTTEQTTVLDSLSENDRILIKGYAGTGKTFLAIEQCKRIALQGGKVLFLCFNKLLAKNIFTQLKAFTPKIVVSNVDSVIYQIISDNYSSGNFSNTNEMRKFLFDRITTEDIKIPVFDYLVIDEGQDILTEEVIKILDNILQNGFSRGRWCIFYDDEVQSELFAKGDLINVLSEIKKNSVLFTLNTNCRNPKNIVEKTQEITGLPIAKYHRLDAGQGNIEFIEYQNINELGLKLGNQLNNIVENGVRPNEITILFPEVNRELINKLYPNIKFRFDGFIDISIMVRNLNSTHQDLIIPHKCISYCTIQSFKGMENEIIVIAGIKSLESEWEKAVLYIGMTRARAKLYVLYSSQLENIFN